ncbi:MAG: cytochrome c biogenesis protein CcsA [Planctomycetes bacterium]|nr:cytochrome c biogenesis protein CcsA [Planctomycetota bacterium]
MPLDTFAKSIAVQLTGRSKWSQKRGPEAFAGRHRVELICDLLFRPEAMSDRRLIAIENRPFRRRLGLDESQRFFTPHELLRNTALQELWFAFGEAQQRDPEVRATPDQKRALQVRASLEIVMGFMVGRRLALVPHPAGGAYVGLGAHGADPGAEGALEAMRAFGRAYVSGEQLDAAAADLRADIDAIATPHAAVARAVRLEVFYNNHRPWLMTAVAYGFAIVAMGLSTVFLRKLLFMVGMVLIAWGTVEQIIGLSLRTIILDRAPVSNTYEALLWMGMVSIGVAVVAQSINRRGWYLIAGTIAAELAVLFAMLVPLADQTNTLPPVLRSNYWLIVHVLTITGSYGVLALAAVLGHVYLVREILLRRTPIRTGALAHPTLVQTYRAIQIGVLMLTAGTILGGVWAADSWGRFWGWDPKETWALISIVVYFTMLHARHIGWLRDFGLAVAAIVGFMSIVWTFYGVNYVMAAGLHSYGFGSGGEVWVALWAAVEIAFLGLCKWRQMALRRMGSDSGPPGPTASLQAQS